MNSNKVVFFKPENGIKANLIKPLQGRKESLKKKTKKKHGEQKTQNKMV